MNNITLKDMNSTSVVEESHSNSLSQNVLFTYSFIIVLTTIFTLSIIFNSVTIVTILAAKVFTPINLLIMNLAVADLTYTLGIPMFIVHAFLKGWPFGQVGCKLFMCAEFYGIVVGVLTVTALSVERYFEVVDKKKRANQLSSKFKVALVIAYIILTWALSTAFTLPFVAALRLASSHDGVPLGCDSEWSEHSILVYFTLKFLLIYFIPLIIISISSVKLLLFLFEWKNTFERNFGDRSRDEPSGSITSSVSCRNELIVRKNSVIVVSPPPPQVKKDSCSSNNKPESAPLPPLTDTDSSSLVITSSNNDSKGLSVCSTRPIIKKRHRNHSSLVRQKASRLVLVVIGLFILQWSPLCLFQFFMLYTSQFIEHGFLINLVVSTLSYSNTIANPMIYMLLTYNFKVYRHRVSQLFARKTSKQIVETVRSTPF